MDLSSPQLPPSLPTGAEGNGAFSQSQGSAFCLSTGVSLHTPTPARNGQGRLAREEGAEGVGAFIAGPRDQGWFPWRLVPPQPSCSPFSSTPDLASSLSQTQSLQLQ